MKRKIKDINITVTQNNVMYLAFRVTQENKNGIEINQGKLAFREIVAQMPSLSEVATTQWHQVQPEYAMRLVKDESVDDNLAGHDILEFKETGTDGIYGKPTHLQSVPASLLTWGVIDQQEYELFNQALQAEPAIQKRLSDLKHNVEQYQKKFSKINEQINTAYGEEKSWRKKNKL